MITGLYPSDHGAWSLGTKLMENVPTVSQALGAAGYHTSLVGKAHFQPLQETEQYRSLESYPTLQDLDFWRSFDQPFYGFDTVRLARNHADEAHVGQHYAIWLEENGCDNWRDYYRPPTGTNDRQKHLWEIPEKYHYNAWIAEESNRQLDGFAESGEPFMLRSSFFDPHPPSLAPDPWHTMYDPSALTLPQVVEGEHDANPLHFRMTQETNPDFSDWRESGFGIHGMHSHLHDADQMRQNLAVYYGMISLMDEYIGRILAHLEQLGLADNTLVVFTTDHGHLFGQHGMTAKGPFHYEDLVKLPFLVRWPDRVEAGSESDALLSLVDMTPSFLSAAGVTADWGMSGVDQTPVWTGAAGSVRDHVVVENRHEPTTIHTRTYIDDRHKLTVHYGRDEGELFDLASDPKEIDNHWADPEWAKTRAKLTQSLLHAELGKEPLAMPRIAGA
jgi:arylsulfatase A-like enzyme